MAYAAEVEGDGERGEQLEGHQADAAGGVHPEQQLGVRVGSGGREAEDHGEAEGGLGDARDVRGAVAGVDLAEGGGQDALFGEGEAVAVDRVVEGEEGGEDAGDDEDVHQVGRPAADIGGDGGEEEPSVSPAAASTTLSSPKAWMTVQTTKA